MERTMRAEARFSYQKRLEDERDAAQRILEQGGADATAIEQEV